MNVSIFGFASDVATTSLDVKLEHEGSKEIKENLNSIVENDEKYVCRPIFQGTKVISYICGPAPMG